ncbi:MAG: TPM domain-containing protein [Muribaculaceae bacterium]|nr:TPM domain-containing protein [Muribaculaceae bacterium]
MKFLMRNKTIISFVVSMMVGFFVTLSAQVPEKPNPPRLINDFAKIFTPQQVAALEDTLVRFSKRTSNQVTIVTVDELGGMDASQFAYEIGEKWGVGGAKHDNGVVILVKPKNETKGQAFIATGYGVEGVLPDASCSRIVNNEMIPAFKNNDYYGGVVRALNVILPVLAKEYSIAEYEKGESGSVVAGLVAVLFGMLLVFIVFLMSGNSKDNDNDRDGDSGTFGGRSSAGDVAAAILLGSLLGGSSSGRSGGSFGGGSFGGGSFGGFGGGSFGGGGAGGSW